MMLRGAPVYLDMLFADILFRYLNIGNTLRVGITRCS